MHGPAVPAGRGYYLQHPPPPPPGLFLAPLQNALRSGSTFQPLVSEAEELGGPPALKDYKGHERSLIAGPVCTEGRPCAPDGNKGVPSTPWIKATFLPGPPRALNLGNLPPVYALGSPDESTIILLYSSDPLLLPYFSQRIRGTEAKTL